MSFDWSAYLILAKELSNKVEEFPDQEAVYRSVVSRAYYSVFCLARNYAIAADNAEFHGDDHKRLQKHFSDHTYKLRKQVGNRLQMLHQHRIKADYHDELDEQPQYKAARAMALADKILEGLTDLYS